jgi:hypothetical protein
VESGPSMEYCLHIMMYKMYSMTVDILGLCLYTAGHAARLDNGLDGRTCRSFHYPDVLKAPGRVDL